MVMMVMKVRRGDALIKPQDPFSECIRGREEGDLVVAQQVRWKAVFGAGSVIHPHGARAGQ